ncbi:multiple epidermal growth factor-like domains protein 8 [Asterias rubens]|uniref:multiple epidermal growth factor-like domains protein 8 n=1 Tax=Asterias rubens TaxID=7604 RepID=UPI001455CF8F|nr:multiple epidermal growth factor-like domains protein 8 [Asterias rubens]
MMGRVKLMPVLLLILCHFWHEVSATGCSGLRRVILDSLEGTVTDGEGFYEENAHCEWLIRAPDPNMTITLTFSEFETECTYDFLTIYDGDSFTGTVLATFSGNLLPAPIVAKSGNMLIHLYSDTNYPLNGTTATYKIQNCSNDCSGHGVCQNYRCVCDNAYVGESCERESCPLVCGYAQDRGDCDFMTMVQKCSCRKGFVGEGCSLSTTNNTNWGDTLLVSSGIATVFEARTGHTAEYHDTTDSLWVFGGYDLNGVLGDLVRFNFTSNQWEQVAPASAMQPTGRYAHSMVLYDDELVIFGGILANGSLTNELWSFDLLTLMWHLLPAGSDAQSTPPGLADHSGTIVNFSHLFVFGGRSQGSNFEDIIYKYDLILRSGWEVISPLGGREADVRVRGHSTVFHLDSKSLIVFGGFRPTSSRFSDRSADIYAFHVEKRYWMKWAVEETGAPMGRTFHSASIIGNYMVVFGGNVHEHYIRPEEHYPSTHERCYDDKVELFHLGCHKWVNFDTIASSFQSSADSPHVHTTSRGRFGHAAAVRDGSTLLIVGGYSGVVLGDLIAVRMPGTVAVNSKVGGSVLDNCLLHSSESTCVSDPNCGWCANDDACLGYSRQSSCSNADTFVLGDCPSICSSLVSCESCIIWGQGVTVNDPSRSRVNEQCGWCVQERQCYQLGEPVGFCGDQSSYTGYPGWWGVNGTYLTEFSQCRIQDHPPGVTWIKYRHPQNISHPDEVTIKEKADNTFTFYYAATREEKSNGGEFIAEYKGFLRPNGVAPPTGTDLSVWMVSSNSISTLYLNKDDSPDSVEKVAYHSLASERQTEAKRDDDSPIIPDASPTASYYFLQEQKQVISNNLVRSVMNLNWNGNLQEGINSQPFTKEFLQPFFSSSCTEYSTCSGCLTDNSCGWCPTSQTCELRDGPMVSVDRCGTAVGITTHHLILQWDQCLDCGLYVDCLTCIENPLCEWLLSGDDAICTRRGRFANSVVNASQCTQKCHEYTNCEDCSKRTKECAWCEVTKTCFSFGTFITSFTYGQCPNWFDLNKECPSCSAFTDCQSCLANFRCGWCGNRDNPTLGNCQEGNFGGPISNQSCNAFVADQYSNITVADPADWSYEFCPDVQECLLGLDNCHPNATCNNTQTGFECTCNRGFKGDGRDECVKTCFHECINGQCSEAPDYMCICDTGWTWDNCSINCGCNNHSNCSTGIGICDSCEHPTMGQFCELCKPGSYGNATDPDLGCLECQCNGHGDVTLGSCDNVTSVCYCTENTKGDHCEECVEGFYHDPRFPQHCSRECDGRMLLTNVDSAALGSSQGDGVMHLSQTYCLWVLTVGDNLTHTAGMTNPPSISFTVEGIGGVCGQDHVYVYDGIPEHLSMSNPASVRIELGAFCGEALLDRVSAVAYSGTMTVIFQTYFPDMSDSPGFAASYYIHRCPGDCEGNRECVVGKCRCSAGYRGELCDIEMCPSNCSADKGQGTCDQDMGVCVCSPPYGGDACQYSILPLSSLGQGMWSPLADEARLDPDASSTIGAVPCGRMGHTLIPGVDDRLWLFGGYSHSQGDMNDVWSFNLDTKQWRRHLSGSVAHPAPRRFHAATFYATSMAISGGMNDTTVMQDVWFFNTISENWSQIPSDFPPLASHSLTLVPDQQLVVIGGYSPSSGLQKDVLEFSIGEGKWLPITVTGTPPTGLFGHSTVWHQASSALYVYGGYRFHLDGIFVSDKLYSLTYKGSGNRWSILPAEPSQQQLPHMFQAAASLNDYMVVIGGGTPSHNASDTLLAYQYNCNQWVDLRGFVVGTPPPPASSLAAVVSEETIYVFGGYDGKTLGSLHKLSLPSDLCALQTTVDGCQAMYGCASCAVTNGTQELLFCISNLVVDDTSCAGVFTQGTVCNVEKVESRECREASSCGECVLIHPAHSSAIQTCKWCSQCPVGACIPIDLSCVLENDCKAGTQRAITDSSTCLELDCEASDCNKCVGTGLCIWSRQFQRAGEIRYLVNEFPIYTWNCFSSQLPDLAPSTIVIQASPPNACPMPCHNHTTCESCLTSDGAAGGSKECRWSDRLGQCISPTYQPLACATGSCGPLAHTSSNSCPTPCYLNTQCTHCLEKPGCGWCALGEGNGTGVCMEGGLYEPTGGVCTAQNVSVHNVPLEESVTAAIKASRKPPVWSFIACPPENECLNGHHDCRENEDCNDTLTSFECNCKPGYYQEDEEAKCLPVCIPPCIRGSCIKPDLCQCDFGYVGKDCSVKCECNGHSTCAGVDSKSDCLKCMNNTQGPNCEKCLPFFIGDPADGGTCVPCSTYCHGNSEICITEENYNLSRDAGLSLDVDNLESFFPIGAVQDAICVNCRNFSAGNMCETCIDGYFKNEDVCQPCQCNGHWDRCDKVTGEDCQCKNNTDTPSCPTEQYPKPCWQHQCSACEELFIGTPTDGHQCYRQMHVDQDTCFDPETQTNCPLDSSPLYNGRASFFVVQPKFTNLDIRLTIDITSGALDVYITYSSEFFKIMTNQTSGRHMVELDGADLFEEAYRSKRGSDGTLRRHQRHTELTPSSGQTASVEPPIYNQLLEYTAGTPINTFVKISETYFVTIIRNLQNRLVVTLPEETHSLKSRKFYIVLLSRESDGGAKANATNGIMYFRQDQPHIDLFVFFSVFLSCFFLFLAILVVGWKVKVGLEARNDRQRRALELEHRASRPIGQVLLFIDRAPLAPYAPPPSSSSSSRRHSRLKKGWVDPHQASRPTSASNKERFRTGSIATEPTEDDMAAVCTTIISLPGGAVAPVQACLGSALVLLKASNRLVDHPPQQRTIRFSNGSKAGMCR